MKNPILIRALFFLIFLFISQLTFAQGHMSAYGDALADGFRPIFIGISIFAALLLNMIAIANKGASLFSIVIHALGLVIAIVIANSISPIPFIILFLSIALNFWTYNNHVKKDAPSPK